MSVPLSHQHQAQSIKLEGTEKFGAEAFCPYLWWAAPRGGWHDGEVYQQGVSGTKHTAIPVRTWLCSFACFCLFLPFFVGSCISCVHTRWEDH